MNWFFTRLTTDSTNKENISQIVGTPFLISKEYSKRMRLHYHILHRSEKTKEQIREMFYDAFPDEPKGTQTLMVLEVGPTIQDWEKVGTYTVKDGDYIHTEEFNDYIEKFKENSFQKAKPYNQALKELIESSTDYEYKDVNWNLLGVKMAILRSEYHLEVYRSKIDALLLSIQISLDNNVAYELFSCD